MIAYLHLRGTALSSHEDINGIDRALISQSLDTVLSSEQFSGSQQLSDFLKYIVSECLAGRQKELKAYSIAIDALGKSDDFDPPIQCGRSRRCGKAA